MTRRRLLTWGIACLCCLYAAAQPRMPRASEELDMALEYFYSGKYHEALLKLERLDKHYLLTPRYHAYMGVCYYYEWQYEKAVKYLDEAIPQLGAFSPHERSFYCYADAESHFQLKDYATAIPLYEQMLLCCHDNEKGDAFYRLGFCYLFHDDRQTACEYFKSALAYYKCFHDTPGTRPRMSQLENMVKGLEESLLPHVGTDE